MRIKQYVSSDKLVWDEFVKMSKNGTFLFFRDYMDYHHDKFVDCSLMFFKQEELVALLPANIVGSEVFSHQGLTYGGLILGFSVSSPDVLEMFDALLAYGKGQGWTHIHYKPVPTIFHKVPSQEDLYALWRYGAIVEMCNISSSVNLLDKRILPTANNRYYHNLLHRKGYTVCYEADITAYWPMLEARLKNRYESVPIHSLEEIKRLQSYFPNQIKCMTVLNLMGDMLGGVISFLMGNVMHIQYSCTSEEGMKSHAMNFLFECLLEYGRNNGFEYFDMGTSNEHQGRILNENLDFWKWSFGGRGIVYQSYLLSLL